MTDFSDFIVYVDESGDHGLTSINPLYPVFVLALCIFKKQDYLQHAVPAMQRFKFDFFGHDMVVLHEREIRKATGSFAFLTDPDRRRAFTESLTNFVSEVPMTLIASAIKKQDLRDQYISPWNPYNIALRFAIERVLFFLKDHDQGQRLTHIVVESRGSKEDTQLELEFRRILDQKSASGRLEILFASKRTNSCGLQIADLVARPIGRRILKPEQANRAFDTLEGKFRRSPTGVINGWGLKIFP